MKYSYKTKGTCSTNIDFDIENDHIYNVTFTGGCNGNLKAVSKLVEGEKVVLETHHVLINFLKL